MKIRTIVLTALCAICASGASANFRDGDFEYVENESNCTLIYYRGSDRYVTIPSVATDSNGKTYRVTAIGNGNIVHFGNPYSVTIPNSVTTISNRAFIQCPITSVTIPNSVTVIGDGAFLQCVGLSSVTIGNSESVTGVTVIGDEAFLHCINLTSVTIGNSVTVIGNKAFLQCGKLYSVTIPNSVTSIGDLAFALCGNLTSVTIGNSASVTGVTSIGISAFANCSRLTSVTLGNSVTSIGDYAFALCDLNSLTIPNSVTSIGNQAFGGNQNTTSITIGNSVTSIGGLAFDVGKKLKIVTVSWATPLPITYTTFGAPDYPNCTLCVPAGTKALYQAADIWKLFGTIVETGIPPQDIVPNSVLLDQHNVSLETGETVQLTATVSPANATNGAVAWTSSNTHVATVSATGLVTAVAEGEATITVRTQSGNRTDACAVTVAAQEVVVDPVPPTDNQPGYLILRLGLPSDDPFTGTFLVLLPAGLSLDLANTVLLGSVASLYDLSITPVSAGTWLVEIRRKTLRSATATTYQEIIRIAYTTDESMPEGRYEIKIHDLEFTFAAHPAIREDEITATVTAGGTGNESIVSTVQATCYNGVLTVASPSAEQVEIYSMSGSLLYSVRKASGTATFRIGGVVPRGILAVRGSSGWNRKVILE